MNQRDRLFVIRELGNWGLWVRQGRTLPNALGYKRRTVEYGIIRGDLSGSRNSGAVIPTWFNIDERVEEVDRAVLKLPDLQRAGVSGLYVRGLGQLRLADILDISRGKLRHELNKAYSHIYQVL